jgi:hypothetical protein
MIERRLALALPFVLAAGAPAKAGDPFADRPANASDLVQRLAIAHARQDLVAMLNLFDWRGLDGPTRHGIEDMVVRDLANQLVEVDVIEAPASGGSQSNGTMPNRVVTHLVMAVYDTATGRRYVSLHQVGEDDDTALIALPVAASY